MVEQERRQIAAILTLKRIGDTNTGAKDLIDAFVEVLREIANREGEINKASQGKWP